MTTTLPTLDDLNTELSEARRRHQDALAEAGLARIGGSVAARQTKAITTTAAEVVELEAAVVEYERAAEVQASVDDERAVSDRRRAFYAWGIDWAGQLDRVAAAKATLDAVEAEALETWHACPRYELVTRHSERYIDPDPEIGRNDHTISETELDPDAVRAIPTLDPRSLPKPRDVPWTPDLRDQVVENLTELLEAEDATAAQGAVA